MRPVVPLTEKSLIPESAVHAPPKSAVPQPLATVRVNVSVAAPLVAGAIARITPTARLETSFTCAPFVRVSPLPTAQDGRSEQRTPSRVPRTPQFAGVGALPCPSSMKRRKTPNVGGCRAPAVASARGATVPDPMARLRSTYV